MAVKVTDLDTLDPTLVEQTHAELNQLMQEKHPEVELTRGVIHDLLQYFSAIFGAKSQTEIDCITRAASLLEISKDPTLADEELTDATLSNWGIIRLEGSPSTGSITIIVSEDTTVAIPSGLVFSANGQQFAADDAFVGRQSGSLLQSSTDRLLEPLGDGNFAFSIEATALEPGPEGNITKGTKMTPEALPNNFVDALAAADFLNGFATETNEELLTRQEEGIAAKAWSNRTNISALIKENFPRVLTMSTIGYGDPEMPRDQHWIFPMSGGGRTDTYIRTRSLPQTTTLQKTATLVSVEEAGGIWQFDVAKDDAPGFYQIESIKLLDANPEDSGFEVTEDIRSADLSDPIFVPDIVTSEEAAYSRFQTAVIRFLDTNTPTAELTVGASTAEYTVGILAMPLIANIQAFISDRGTRNAAGDALLKAPVPCFLTVNFDLRLPAGVETPDLDVIKNDLAETVNRLGFPGQLHSSLLADVIHNSLVGRTAVGPIDMFGKIRRPDGTITFIRDTAIIEIPDEPDRLVTGRTTVYILDPRDIGITPIVAGFPNI